MPKTSGRFRGELKDVIPPNSMAVTKSVKEKGFHVCSETKLGEKRFLHRLED